MADLDITDGASRREKAEAASRRKDLQQHADKILQGLESLTEIDDRRAIWELIQNAVDLADEAEILFRRSKNGVTFSHRGRPFNSDTLLSLIKQVSSKDADSNEKEVGQYGTGFLSTHSFGKSIVLNSVIVEDEVIIPLKAFSIDRSITLEDLKKVELDALQALTNEERGRPNAKRIAMMRKIDDQVQEVFELLEQEETISDWDGWTSFQYIGNDENENSNFAVKALKDLLPYIMVFNPRLKSVELTDDTTNEACFWKRGELCDFSDGKTVSSLVVLKNEVAQTIYYLRKGESIVILPLLEGGTKAIELGSEIPRLYLFFPLIGTDHFGINFLLHSRDFCPNEPRSALHLKSKNEDTQNKEQQNQKLVEGLFDMIFEYLSQNVDSIDDPFQFAKVAFPIQFNNSVLDDYYTKQQKSWQDKLAVLNLVNTISGRKAVHETRFFERRLFEGNKLSASVYRIVSSIWREEIPVSGNVIEWTNILERWQEPRIRWISIEEIAGELEKRGSMEGIDLVDLIACYNHFRLHSPDIFEDHALLPNLKGDFRKKSELVKTAFLSKELIELLEVVSPSNAEKIVHKEFGEDFGLAVFGPREFTSAINDALNEQLKDQETSSGLSREFLKAFVKLGSFVKSEDSENVSVLMAQLVCEFYDLKYEPLILEVAILKQFETRAIENKLAKVFLYDLAAKDTDWVSSNLELLKKALSLRKKDNYKDLFQTIPVVPNQVMKLCLAKDLSMDRGIPDEIKKMYDDLQCEEQSIYENLLHVQFSEWHDGNEITSKTLASKIEEKFFDNLEGGVIYNPNLKDYLHKVIGGFKHGETAEDGRASVFTSATFPRTWGKRSEILVSWAQGEHTFSILSLEDSQLMKLGQLAQNPAMLQRILELGEQAAEEELRKGIDTRNLHGLGDFVENIVQEGLQELLGDRDEVQVSRQQNGQDIILRRREKGEDDESWKDIYFIEVKSKWNPESPIRLTKNQTIKASENPDHFALCVFDMTQLPMEERKIERKLEEYPTSMVRFNLSIGSDVAELVGVLRSLDETEKIRLDGDMRTYIPKSYIEKGNVLDEFKEELIKKLRLLWQPK